MKKLKSKPYLCIWLVSLFISLIYLTLAFNNSIWTDEAYTLWIIKGNFKEIVRVTSFDVHPPLYYFLARIVYLLFPGNQTLLFQKILAITAFFLLYGITGCWMWKRGFGKTALIFSALFMFATPCTMIFSVQLRMYAWAMFFVTMCGLNAYDCYKEGRLISWIMIAITAALAGYMNYFALVSAFVIYMLLGMALIITNRKTLIKWFISGCGVALLYMPWLFIMLKQFTKMTKSGHEAIEPITKRTLLSYLEWAFGDEFQFVFILVTAVYVGVGIISLINIKKEKSDADLFAQCCWLVPFLTMSFGVMVSLITNPIYYKRYVISALGILFVGVGITLRKVKIKEPLSIALIVFMSLIGIQQYRENYIQEYVANGAADFTRFVHDNVKEDDTVLYNLEVLKMIYEYYVGDNLCLYSEADFSENQKEWYYIYTPGTPSFSEEELEEKGILCEYVKDAYIEEARFQILRLYKQ